MAEDRSIIRVDRVETAEWVESPALWKAGIGPALGDLFLTSDGMTGFQSVHEKEPNWMCSLKSVRDLDATVTSFGLLLYDLGKMLGPRSGKYLRATFDGKRRTIVFTGVVPMSSRGILGRIPFHVGQAVTVVKFAYDQYIRVPKEPEIPKTQTGRARQACAWWVEVLREGTSLST
jgi:hypothetical protein